MIKIKSTYTVRNFALQAVKLQESTDSNEVIGLLAYVASYFSNNYEQAIEGNDIANRNPITRALVQRLCQLAGMPIDENDTCHIDCCLLASDDKNEGVDFKPCEN